MLCFFVSDLHGKKDRYRKLFVTVREKKPELLLLGGDMFPSYLHQTMTQEEFLTDVIVRQLDSLQRDMGKAFPKVCLILGNDDGKRIEPAILKIENSGLWQYVHQKKITVNDLTIFGYNYSPPSPFLLKDWERYDVSRYVDPGCVSPEEGQYTVEMTEYDKKYTTISKDLDKLVAGEDLTKSIFLFHAPPYKSDLDRAALDGKKIDHVSLDVHVGSIAIRRFIEEHEPMLTLHGHIHESTTLTGNWNEKIGKTLAVNGAHDGEDLVVIEIDTQDLTTIQRRLY